MVAYNKINRTFECMDTGTYAARRRLIVVLNPRVAVSLKRLVSTIFSFAKEFRSLTLGRS